MQKRPIFILTDIGNNSQIIFSSLIYDENPVNTASVEPKTSNTETEVKKKKYIKSKQI
ncbi:MAG: hypothetical protein PHN88_15480 [Ignavibacteria bacterium]|nr:hypothetical protein [Ignavibacteria bacterium]